MVEMIAQRRFSFQGRILSIGDPFEVHAATAAHYERRNMARRSAPAVQSGVRPDWFPNWRGQTVVIVGAGSGQSDLKPWKGKARVIAVNRSYERAPWADVLYACDDAFWLRYGADFKGLKVTQSGPAASRDGLCQVKLKGSSISTVFGVLGGGGNSGFQAINLAVQFGAARIILVGFDMTTANGVHWHGPHPAGMNNPSDMSTERWRKLLDGQAPVLHALGVQVINATPKSALTAFPVMTLADAMALPAPSRPLVVKGMHGLGDNLHQRAVIRELSRDREVWLDTPWPSLYHDIDVKLVSAGTRLRTQAKNLKREADLLAADPVPASAERLTLSYPVSEVRRRGSVLGAMSAIAGVPVGDFRLPIPPAWFEKADALIRGWAPARPLMIYRPLGERAEWGACRNRNPDFDAYRDLFEQARDQFFVVSVADFAPGKEWMTGHPVDADVSLHGGELDFQTLAALFSRAGLIFTAPGFATVLGQAVETPTVTVFGGYEDASSFLPGARFSPWLAIEPKRPCACWSHTHGCDKAIDAEQASRALADFLEAHHGDRRRRAA